MTHSLIFGLATLCTLLYHACGAVAQWLEQGTHNPLVVGSSPSGPSFYPLTTNCSQSDSVFTDSISGRALSMASLKRELMPRERSL